MKSTFVENRTFDTRLTKSALLRDFKRDAEMFNQRPDYRQIKSTFQKESWKYFNWVAKNSSSHVSISFLSHFKHFSSCMKLWKGFHRLLYLIKSLWTTRRVFWMNFFKLLKALESSFFGFLEVFLGIFESCFGFKFFLTFSNLSKKCEWFWNDFWKLFRFFVYIFKNIQNFIFTVISMCLYC